MEKDKKEDLKWEKRDKLNIANIVEQVGNVTKQVVDRELEEAYKKLLVLQRMGFIKDKNAMKTIQKKLANIKEKIQK